MSNLRDGIININGNEIKSTCKLSDIQKFFCEDDIKVIKSSSGMIVVKSKTKLQIDNRDFEIVMFFKGEKLSCVNLQIYRPNRLEFDFWEWVSQNVQWLIDQLGTADGIKEEKIFNWGKVTSWASERSRDGGISIYYNQK